MSRRLPPAIRELLTELESARGDFDEALRVAEPALLEVPGLVGEWSGRQLLGHLAYWAEHAAGAIAAASRGASEEFDDDDLDVEERNAAVAAEAAERPLPELREREAAAYLALHAALEAADPAWLDERMAYGDSLAQVIRDDGSDHYREHTLDLRAWFAGGPDEADEPDEEDDA
jgi:Mycothiol maleylpyruvate isomerase N-terminal domain